MLMKISHVTLDTPSEQCDLLTDLLVPHPSECTVNRMDHSREQQSLHLNDGCV